MEKARKHGNLGLAGIPTGPGKYHCSRVCEAEIVLFLDFNQFGRLVLAVASTWNTVFKLSSNKKVVMWKSLSGFDIACEGTDAFDCMISRMKFKL